MIEKGTYTKQEILSQPKVWAQSINVLLNIESENIPFDKLGQVIVSGCGSTYYLSQWAAALIRENHSTISQSVPGSELWLSPNSWYRRDGDQYLILISRSGTTTETINAAKIYLDREEGKLLSVSCDPHSPLAQYAPAGIYFPHAQEKSIAQTRSFTNMMLGVAHLVFKSIPKNLSQMLSERGSHLLDNYREKISHFAQNENLQKFFILGSDRRYGLACEAMLKLKEMSLSYSEAYHFLEFRHGPMSMVDSNALIIGLLNEKSAKDEIEVLKDIHELGGKTLVIGPQSTDDIPNWIDGFFPIQVTDLNGYGDVLYLPLLQWLAFERAIANGLNPDHPNNLKAVVELNE